MKKKNLKDCMQYLLGKQNGGAEALIEKFDIPDGEATGTMLVAAALLNKAQSAGDVSAVREIRSIVDTTAETQNKKLEVVIKTK